MIPFSKWRNHLLNLLSVAGNPFGAYRTLPLSGRQTAWGGTAGYWWWPVHSRGLLEGIRYFKLVK